jgi:acylphosphatase
MVSLSLEISGRVQGVGFRYSMREEAARRGVRGWVRNRRDGSVEALVQGDAAAVDGLLEWARRGPPGARVSEVKTSAVEEPAHHGFEMRPTL